MTERIEEYTVGELARLSGVTVRLLHHYDEIGLLKPAVIGPNGYRYYGRSEAERLQEILALKAGGVPLAEIGAVLDGGGDRVARLNAQLARLKREAAELAGMIEALETTISNETKGHVMAVEDLYRPFSPERQAAYEDWLAETYGPEMARAVQRSREQAARNPVVYSDDSIADLRKIEADLVAAYENGVAPEDADLAAHRDWVGRMWGQPCTPEAHAGLAEIYLAHPDFIGRFETLSPGFSAWLAAAMKAGVR